MSKTLVLKGHGEEFLKFEFNPFGGFESAVHKYYHYRRIGIIASPKITPSEFKAN